jgi:pimeloyl-ACP methyl ester carboxylesterase
MLIQDVSVRQGGGVTRKGSVVLVNGCMCDRTCWGKFDPLIASGHTVASFNVRGYVEGSHFRTLALELAQLCRDHKLVNPNLIVHSKGGLVAIAFLNLVKEQGYEEIRPRSVVFVTPILDDPRKTFPKGDAVVNLASAFIIWRVDRILRSIENNGRPGELGEMRSHLIVQNTLTAFQLASPALIRYLGGGKQVREEFVEFLRHAKQADRVTTLMEFNAMCREGPELHDALLRGEIYMPEKVLGIVAPYDPLVDPEKAVEIMTAAFRNKTWCRLGKFEGAGHFPFREQPREFLNVLRDFIDKT